MAWLSMLAAAFLLFHGSQELPPPDVPSQGEAGEDREAAPAAPDIIGLGVDAQERMTIPVRIDGNGPYPFLIDTGSERTIISRPLAMQLALEYGRQARLLGMAGSRIVDTVYLPQLTVGKQDYGEINAPLLEPQDIGVDGILGLDGLQDQRILFNFEDNEIEIEDVRERGLNSGYEIVVRAKRKNGQLIFTNAMLAGIRIDVVIDTGSQANIGNRALQAKLSGRRAKGTNTPTELKSVTGHTLIADAGIVPNLRIGTARFGYIPIVFADSPPFEALNLADKPALFLGMGTLRQFDRVAIDFGKRKVYFDVPDGRPATGTRIRP